jgi:hypothetical protein
MSDKVYLSINNIWREDYVINLRHYQIDSNFIDKNNIANLRSNRIITMLTDTLKILYSRDLVKLKQELELYNSEDNIWRVDKNILNSAGNLSLHLIGNLNTYIGAELGNTGYVRNRPEEFSLNNVPRQELISKIERTIEMLDATLDSLTEDQLKSEYPQIVFDNKVLTEYFLIHLAIHLSYHLGQVNYHRRLLDY